MTVGLFIPCYVDQLYPNAAIATLELLEKLGVEVVYPLKQTCCGQPMANSGFEHLTKENSDPHTLEDVDLAIIEAHFGVAENGALWVTEELLSMRVVPFICQHLAIVVSQKNILPLMHHAYERIGAEEYGFGVFIAGPSKTADIEQSLVLGAHGARTLSVFLLDALL